jgi:prefoldin beta subunit
MINMNKDIQEKINQLSMLEQNMQNFSNQKQQFQAQLIELESAEKELGNSKEAYKIIGNIMVARDKEELLKEISEKKEIVNLRINSFEKQEDKLKQKAEELQKEVLDGMKKDEQE